MDRILTGSSLSPAQRLLKTVTWYFTFLEHVCQCSIWGEIFLTIFLEIQIYLIMTLSPSPRLCLFLVSCAYSYSMEPAWPGYYEQLYLFFLSFSLQDFIFHAISALYVVRIQLALVARKHRDYIALGKFIYLCFLTHVLSACNN